MGGRRGSLVLLLVLIMGITGNTIVLKFISDANDQYSAALVTAYGYRAHLLSLSGFQAGMTALKTIPEEYLFTTGMVQSPPDLMMDNCEPGCYITYRIQPEDGKFNLNNLVRLVDDEPNAQNRAIAERLFSYYNIPLDTVDSLIDWVDENDFKEGRGAESIYYNGLKPPRKIKNYQLFSLSEASLVKGMERDMLFASRAPAGWEEQKKELKFETEDEKNMITMDDWVPANNLTAYYIKSGENDERININAARYHLLMSLSDAMTDRAVKAIFKLRRENNGYMKDLKSLKDLPEFQVTTPAGISLYDELVGAGGQATGLVKKETSIYRITGVGTVLSRNPDPKKGSIVRQVTAIYDKKNKRILYYFAD